jgi:hypothetical protein
MLMGRGRLQTLPVAYDVRRKEWFDTALSGVRHFPGEEHIRICQEAPEGQIPKNLKLTRAAGILRLSRITTPVHPVMPSRYPCLSALNRVIASLIILTWSLWNTTIFILMVVI